MNNTVGNYKHKTTYNRVIARACNLTDTNKTK